MSRRSGLPSSASAIVYPPLPRALDHAGMESHDLRKGILKAFCRKFRNQCLRSFPARRTSQNVEDNSNRVSIDLILLPERYAAALSRNAAASDVCLLSSATQAAFSVCRKADFWSLE